MPTRPAGMGSAVMPPAALEVEQQTVLRPEDADAGPDGQIAAGAGDSLFETGFGDDPTGDISHFLSVPWCRAHLLPSEGRPAGSAAAQQVRVVLPSTRRLGRHRPKTSSDDGFDSFLSNTETPDNAFTNTLNTRDTIPAFVLFYEEPQTSYLAPLLAPVVEIKALMALGAGITGHVGVAHGGLVGAILDEVTGMIMPLNQARARRNQTRHGASEDEPWGPPPNQRLPPAEEAACASAHVHSGFVTAYLNITYVRPVRTLTSVLVTARFVRMEGSRKFYVEGAIWDADARLLARADVLFVALRNRL